MASSATLVHGFNAVTAGTVFIFSSKPTSELGGSPVEAFFGALLSRRTQRRLPNTRAVLYSPCIHISRYRFQINQYSTVSAALLTTRLQYGIYICAVAAAL